MADYSSQFEKVKSNIINSLRGFFPIVGKRHELILNDISAKDDLAMDDFPKQVKAYDEKGDFSIAINASLTLKEVGGKTLDKVDKIKILSLPKITSRGTYILGGNEYQIPNQLLLKPNVYNRIKENGELETFVNIKPVALHIFLDPESGIFSLQYGNQKKVSLYHFLSGLGVSDLTMDAAWGSAVVNLNKKSRGVPLRDVYKFYEMAYNEPPENSQAAVDGVLAYLSEKKLDHEGTKLTIGKSYANLGTDVLIASASKLIALNKGEQDPDERDALHFKRLSNIEEFLTLRLEKEKRKLLFKIRQRLDSKETIREIIKSDVFNAPIHSFFTNSNISTIANQLNPLASFAESNKITIMGEGGIENEYAVTEDARATHPSQLGFIDPIHTPESGKIGIVNQLGLHTRKDGENLVTKMINAKTGKYVDVTPMMASQSVVSFRDQYDSNFKAKSNEVKASIRNKMGTVTPSQVDYILADDQQIFSIPSNMTPFINHISGNRSMMSGKHMEQALPLKYREAPLVQNMAPGGVETFESRMAKETNIYADTPGIIKNISKDAISIEMPDGKVRKAYIYNKYINPTDKVYFDHQPTVKVGDKVKAGQLIAESNFSKDNVYAVGTNLTVAFTPYKGHTFEDGISISESAAKKLTSLHIYKERIGIDTNSILDKKQFLAMYPTKISSENFAKLGEDGVIGTKQKVKHGDVLIAHLHKEDYTKEDILMAQFNKKFLKPYKNRSLNWDEDFDGIVEKVIRRPREIEVQISTEEPARLGDKLSARAGNKGIVTHIIPDNETPLTESGTPIDVFMNPHSIIGRINPAQILENAAGKVADKTGNPYLVENFSNENHLNKIEDLLKKNGLTDKEKIIDPNGTEIQDPISIGKMHILKLNHPVRKKFQVRETGTYTSDYQPVGGGGRGARRMDQLTIYGMLSHGATANLNEAMTHKSEKNDDFWHAYQAGLPIPKPKIPFVFEKFEAMLRGSGINMERKADSLQLRPLTDKDVISQSKGEISEPEFIQGKNLNEIKGGLFDPEITGGMEGKGWGHIKLNEEIPNPVFETAILSILNINNEDYSSIVRGTKYVDKNGNINDKDGLTGGPGIKRLLELVNVNKEFQSAISSAEGLTGPDLNRVNKKIRYLKALKETGNDPTVYMTKYVPVIPTIFRPINPDESGRLNIAPANPLYRDLMLVNNQLQSHHENNFPDSEKVNLRKNLYQAYGALVGLDKSLTEQGMKEQPGFLQVIAGNKPKEGFFQKRMLAKRQDYSATSTVIPEPDYGLDDIGIPEEMAWKLYKPHIVRRLRQLGYTPNNAIKEVDDKTKLAKGLLDQELQHRPVMMNRAPSLHKFSIMAFNPKLTAGKAIRVSPLTVAGFNMDMDGDCTLSECYISININKLQKSLDKSKKNTYITDINKWINERKISMPSVVKLPVKNGDVTIHVNLEDFPRLEDTKTIKENGTIFYKVPEGISIFTCDNVTRKIVNIPVTEFSIHPDLDNYIVDLSDGNDVWVSSDHSLMAYDFESSMLKKIKPIDIIGCAIPKIRNLDINETVKNIKLIDYSNGHKKRPTARVVDNIDLTEKLGHFIGMMVGDGWLSLTGGRNDICFANIEDELIKAFSAGVDSLLQESVSMYSIDSPHEFKGFKCFSKKHTKCSMSLAKNILGWIGHMAENKHLPVFYLSSPKEFRFGLLAGLIDTDGTSTWGKAKVKKNPQYIMAYSTISERLANEIVTLSRSLGINASITITPKEYRVVFSALTLRGKNINIRHPKKKDAFEKYKSTPISDVSLKSNVGRHDHVPFDDGLYDFCKKHINNSDYVSITRMYRTGTIPRRLAKKFIENIKGLPQSWIDVVNDENITWVHAVRAKKNNRRITMYDITAPGPYTFMLNTGIIVQDTVGIHVPIGEDARQEAKRMLPSNNLFNPRDNDLIHTPDKEPIAGLYLMTTPGKIVDKKYTKLEDIVEDYKQHKLAINNQVTFKGQQTTIGVLIVNSVLPSEYQESNIVMDKKKLLSILSDIAEKKPHLYGEVATKLKNLGHDAVYNIGLTTGLEDLKIDYVGRDKIINDAKDALKKDGISGLSPFVAKLNAFTKETLKNKNSGFSTMLQSGSSGKIDATRQMTATPFVTTDHHGHPIPMIIEKSYTEGLDAPSYWSTLSGARKGMMDRALSTREPGEFTKELINTVISSQIREEDCKTHHGIDLITTDKDNVIGRYDAESGKLITDDYLRTIKTKTIKVRSPLTCESMHPPCSKCFGSDERGKLPQVGTYAGVIAGHALSEPSTQLILRQFHTGGALVSDKNHDLVHTGFDRVKELLNLPKIVKNKAVLSESSGKVNNIMTAPQGGWNVQVGESHHYLPGNLSTTVKMGETVEKGDRLSTGTVKPQELAGLKDPLTAKLHMVNELDKAYKSEGRAVRKNLFETVVSSLLSKGQITDPGKSDFMHGDVANLNKINKMNKDGDGIKYVPLFQGLNQAPLQDDDFLTRLNFQRLKETLTEGVSRLWKSDIKGTSPIPALVTGEKLK